MQVTREVLEREFICPKCRGRGALVQELQLGRGGVSALLPLAAGRFLAATCGLCGFTELYSQSAAARNEQEAAEGIASTQAAEEPKS